MTVQSAISGTKPEMVVTFSLIPSAVTIYRSRKGGWGGGGGGGAEKTMKAPDDESIMSLHCPLAITCNGLGSDAEDDTKAKMHSARFAHLLCQKTPAPMLESGFDTRLGLEVMGFSMC